MESVICSGCGEPIHLTDQVVAQHDPATDSWKVWHPSCAPPEMKNQPHIELTLARIWVFTESAAHRKQQAETKP